MSEEFDTTQDYLIMACPRLKQYTIWRNQVFIAAADSYGKIEAIYEALVFNEKMDALASRTPWQYK